MVEYLVFLTISASLYALFALGLNLQWGFTGLINFGHVAFMTIGAYTTVLLAEKGFPLFSAVIIGAIFASLLGLLIGLTSLKLREDYLAIVTIGVSELIRLIVQNEQWLTKGTFGIQSYQLPLGNFQPNLLGKVMMIIIFSVLGIFVLWQLWKNVRQQLRLRKQIQGKSYQPSSVLNIYLSSGLTLILILITYINGIIALYNYNYKAGLMLLILITLTVVYYGLDLLVHSPWGRVLKAIREDEEIPKALGKNVFFYKLQSFMLGGAIAGIAGAFYTWQLTTIYPSSFETLLTFNAWIIVVLGGSGNNAGVILGSIIFWSYDSLTRFIFSNSEIINDAQVGALRIMIIGLILMILMISRPQGILGKKAELSLNN
ncbi:branched-chain amino acid transport system permease protein LivM [Geminocystis sp. NIES-3708]|uniref:branched-chain amino acid ABC transporter permease n=1 Tax=Geminocystis sp. NIES-3708 TaxID=1615909 RepID=UPI0005FC868A|nr:branched-chain amino acid ABC transporter permease [Geminocystis sp. NIES-3708]BAQ62500.1 branched-chain amino acid transport system permease protein LivM [Geminocystis sp. NIES-3708]